MSILNYFKKVDQNKLTPKSEKSADAGVLSAKKGAAGNQLEEKAKKKLALNADVKVKDKENQQNDIEMDDQDLKKKKSNDFYDDESDDIKPASSKMANRLSEAGRDSPKVSKRKRIMVLDSDSDASSDEKGESLLQASIFGSQLNFKLLQKQKKRRRRRSLPSQRSRSKRTATIQMTTTSSMTTMKRKRKKRSQRPSQR